jgi:hypothetical protein
VLAVLVVVFGARALVGDKDQTASTSVVDITESDTSYDNSEGPSNVRDYPEEVRDNFMQACTVNTDAEPCLCLLEAIEEEFSYEEFVKLEQDLVNGSAGIDIIEDLAGPCNATVDR